MYLPYYYNLNNQSYNGTNMNMNTSNISYKIEDIGTNINQRRSKRNLGPQWKGQDYI